MPSSPQRAARGWPKSALLQPEPACPGAWAAAGPRRRAKGQGSPLLLLLLLLLLPPAAKENRARACQWRPPAQRSRSLPCPALAWPALPCPACSAVLSSAAGRAGSQQLRLSGSGSEAPESRRATGTAWPSPRPALLQAVSSSRGSVSPQNHVQRPLPSGCPCFSRGRPPLRCHTCMATLKGQVSTAQPVAGRCLSLQNSPGERQSPPPLLDGAVAGPGLGPSCKNQAAFREQPRRRKGHRRAATQHQQPERGRAGSLCPRGLSAPRGRFPPSAASEDVPAFLLAPQPSPLPEWHRGTLPPSLPPSCTSSPHSLHLPGTPAQPEAGERQPFSPLPGPPSASPGSWR